MYCAKGTLTSAIVDCMSLPSNINVDTLESEVAKFAEKGLIDSPKNLEGSKVFIFAGTKDVTVNPAAGKKG